MKWHKPTLPDCEGDCTGHEAGYKWAVDNTVIAPEFDKTASRSFNEGVRAYGLEFYERLDHD